MYPKVHVGNGWAALRALLGQADFEKGMEALDEVRAMRLKNQHD